MSNNTNIVKEIMENVSNIPIECQEHILDIVRAMVFTREVVTKEQLGIKNDEKEDN